MKDCQLGSKFLYLLRDLIRFERMFSKILTTQTKGKGCWLDSVGRGWSWLTHSEGPRGWHHTPHEEILSSFSQRTPKGLGTEGQIRREVWSLQHLSLEFFQATWSEDLYFFCVYLWPAQGPEKLAGGHQLQLCEARAGQW